MNKRQTAAVERVRRRAADVKATRGAERKASSALQAAVVSARKAGVPVAVVAETAGVSKGRVSQIAADDDDDGHGSHAQKKALASVRVADGDTVPVVSDTAVVVHPGLVSVRERRRYARATMFYDVASGAACMASGAMVPGAAGDEPGSLAEVLAAVSAAEPEAVARVYLTGPPPWSAEGGATRAEAVRAWALSTPAPGWSASPAGHYLHEPDKPVLRFTHANGHRVTVHRAAAWWGETSASVETCAAAWRGLEHALDQVPAFRGAGLADTPATAGRVLWARTIPEGGGWPVMGDELRALIAETAGQGRVELLPAARPTVERFTYLDGRMMYAALTWGMPVGEPIYHGPDASLGLLSARGRWRVTATVPDGWRHVGLLMAPAASRADGWLWPREPGQRFTTWADGSEVLMAQRHGWGIELHQGFTWREGKPLNTWRDALVKVWQAATGSRSEAGALAAKAVRAMILYAIGAFASREHNTTGSCPADRPEMVPEVTVPGSVRRVGDSLVWEVPGQQRMWSAAKSHPEWSALVWARARVRVTEAALTVPFDRVVGFATDALYLDGDPGLPDDGRPGAFRVKGHTDAPMVWPANRAALYAARDDSERNQG